METIKYYRGIAPVNKRGAEPGKQSSHMQYDPTLNTGRLRAELAALQPLHVGSGLLAPPEKLGLHAPDVPLVKALIRKVGVEGTDAPFIPGSSLKGVFRSLVEMLTAACVSKTNDRDAHNECRYNSKRQEGEICPACRMFGAMGYQGKVRFGDAALLSGATALHFLPPQYQPHSDKDNPRRRYYPHRLVDPRTEANWPLEVILPGARFAVTGQFTNLSAAELGLLLIVLGQGEWALCPKVGAGKSCGMGAVQIAGLTVETLDLRRAYTQLDDAAAWQPVDPAAYFEAAKTLYQAKTLETLARDLNAAEVPHG